MLYGTISEFCTVCECPDMAGPGNRCDPLCSCASLTAASCRQFQWVDDKGKRNKLPAPQYIDFALTYIQRTVNDESVFPTKFGTSLPAARQWLTCFADKDFPISFDSHVKKIIRLLFNVLAHLYHSHFREIVLLNLHSHLNCLFSHLVLFNDQFKLMDEKEAELLVDDVYQVNISELQCRNQAMDVDVPKSDSSNL